MGNKHSSPFDGSDYFDKSDDHLDIHEKCGDEQDQDDLSQPLLSHQPSSKLPRKRSHLMDFFHGFPKKPSKRRQQPSVQEGTNLQIETATPPTMSENFHWEYDRFDISVPDSIPELLIHLNRGRHPEILELAIESKQRLTPDSQYGTLEYKILGAMLVTIREVRRKKELDAIQSQTLAQLGRHFDYFRLL